MATAKKTVSPQGPKSRKSTRVQALLYDAELAFLDEVATDGNRSIVVDAALSVLRDLPPDVLAEEIEAARSRRLVAQSAPNKKRRP